MNRPSRFSTRYFSSCQENNVAKAVKGRRTANSGATTFSKGDVTTNKILLECKTTIDDKKSFTIKKEWISTAANSWPPVRRKWKTRWFGLF